MFFKKKKVTADHSNAKHIDIIRDIRNRKYELWWIERYIALFLCILKLVFPTRWIRHYTRNLWYRAKNRAIEIYLVIKVVTLFVIIATQKFTIFTIWVTIYFLIDIIQYLLGLIFLAWVYTKIPSIRRNFAHLCMNIIEIVLCFAILYLYTESLIFHNVVVHDSFLSIFYSFMTFAFVWDNEILPTSIIARKLIFSQISISFLFIVIIISSFVAWLEIKNDD